MDDSIGKYLADLSTSINAWMEKTLTASTQQERNNVAAIRRHRTDVEGQALQMTG